MKIYFAGSNHDLKRRIERYRRITTYLKENGHVLTRQWIEDDLKRQIESNPYSLTELQTIWREVKSAILEADAVVLDISKNSYSIGYQTAFALSNKKPVLVLSDNTKIRETVIIGEDNPLLTIAQYNDISLNVLLENFLLKFSSNKKDMRFNMLLDRETQVFLELESHRTGRTKARVIRDLLQGAIKDKSGL